MASKPRTVRAIELSTLNVAKLIDDLHALIVRDVDCSLTPKQIRSPDVNLCLIRPLVYYIRDNTPAKAAIFALLVNMLSFQRAAEEDLAIQELHKTRANVCEVVAVKLLKHLGMRDLIDALTFDFSTTQGECRRTGTASNADLNHPSLANLNENSRMNALEIAILARAKDFTASPLVQEVVNQIWCGNIVFYASELDDELLDEDDDEDETNLSPNTQRDQLYEEERRALLRDRINTSGTNFARSRISRRPSNASGAHFFSSRRRRRGLSDEELRTNVPNLVHIYNNTQLEFGWQDVLRVSRLRVPRYQYIVNILIFAVFIAVYTVVVILRPSSPLESPAEILLDILVIAYTLDEIQQLRESGIQWYLENLWNIFDVMIYLTFVAFIVLRAMALEREDDELSTFALNFLACIAVLLWPRLFAVLDGFQFFGTLLITLKHMIWDMARFFVLLLVFFIGWMQAFYALASTGTGIPTGDGADFGVARIRTAFAMDQFPIPIPRNGLDPGEPPAGGMTYSEIIWVMLKIFFGSQYVGFDIASDFHPIFGPVLMVSYVAISTLVLMTMIIAIMTQSFADIVSNAKTEFLFSFTLKVLEHIKSDNIFPFLPPFNLVQLAITPMQGILKPKRYTALMRNGLRICFFPVLMGIFIYEWSWNRRKARFQPDEYTLSRSPSVFTPLVGNASAALQSRPSSVMPGKMGRGSGDAGYPNYNSMYTVNENDLQQDSSDPMHPTLQNLHGEGDRVSERLFEDASQSSQGNGRSDTTLSDTATQNRPTDYVAVTKTATIPPKPIDVRFRPYSDSSESPNASAPASTRTSLIMNREAGKKNSDGSSHGSGGRKSQGSGGGRERESVLGDLTGQTPVFSGRKYGRHWEPSRVAQNAQEEPRKDVSEIETDQASDHQEVSNQTSGHRTPEHELNVADSVEDERLEFPSGRMIGRRYPAPAESTEATPTKRNSRDNLANDFSEEYLIEMPEDDVSDTPNPPLSTAPESYTESVLPGMIHFGRRNLGQSHKRSASEPRGRQVVGRSSTAAASPLIRRMRRDSNTLNAFHSYTTCSSVSSAPLSPAVLPLPWSVTVREGYSNGADAESTLRKVEGMESRVERSEAMLEEILKLLKTGASVSSNPVPTENDLHPSDLDDHQRQHQDQVPTFLPPPLLDTQQSEYLMKRPNSVYLQATWYRPDLPSVNRYRQGYHHMRRLSGSIYARTRKRRWRTGGVASTSNAPHPHHRQSQQRGLMALEGDRDDLRTEYAELENDTRRAFVGERNDVGFLEDREEGI